MSFIRAGHIGDGRLSTTAQGAERVVRERRAVTPGHVCTGTLACRRCDAPVSAGDAGLSLAQDIACPFCSHRAPVRDFLSLTLPTRPARVMVRVSRPPGP